jgi:hypothetical protein
LRDIVIDTDTGTLVMEFNKLEKAQRDRILGYVEAFCAMKQKNEVIKKEPAGSFFAY